MARRPSECIAAAATRPPMRSPRCPLLGLSPRSISDRGRPKARIPSRPVATGQKARLDRFGAPAGIWAVIEAWTSPSPRGTVAAKRFVRAAGSLKGATMLNIRTLRQEWASYTSYERFEQIVSRIIMLFVAVVIVYAVILTGIELVDDFWLGRAFMEQELLQDIFGSILTILILLEFNHSIAAALTHRTGVIQVRIVVLLAILV